jgi:hypothetical protein
LVDETGNQEFGQLSRYRKLTFLLILPLLVLAVGCEDEADTVYDPAPQPPQGVYTVTGDDSVFVFWNSPYERDVVEFVIWRSYEEFDNYVEIARVNAVDNPDLDLIYYEPGYIDDSVSNGQTYYYAVSSVDAAGQVSELSAESAFDTPRPDGLVTLYDSSVAPGASGFDFSAKSVSPAGSAATDVLVDRDGTGVFYINRTKSEVLLQPMGYTYSFDDIGWAPQSGWIANYWTELVEGHTYVIAVKDTHGDWNYAKMRVLALDANNGSAQFQWAYQESVNNPELVPPPPATDVRGAL